MQAEMEPKRVITLNLSKTAEAITNSFIASHPELFSPSPSPEFPEDLYHILDYVPVLFHDESEDKYIDALMTAVETSYENSLYQFAYMQYHMLFMSSIYYVLLKLYYLHKEEFDNALYYLLKDRTTAFYKDENTKDGKLFFGSFAAINESDVFMLLKVIGLDANLEGQLKKLVKERNEYAHANGRTINSDAYLMEKLNEYNQKIDKVFALLKPEILHLYQSALTDPDFNDPDVREYADPAEQIQEFIRDHALSFCEINWCRKLDIRQFSEHPAYEQIKELHFAMRAYYKTISEGEEE